MRSTIDGFIELARRLFQLDLRYEEPQAGETWHPTVSKLVARDSTSRVIGVVYLDLYQRSGKFSGSANFPIRFRTMHSESAKVALVMSQPPPSKNAPSLLAFHDVVTLWHELGHTLQSLLSETRLQHFSGTRSLQDSVETVSLLFEHFAQDYRVLRRFGRHWKTGETLPERIFADELARSNVFGALDLQSSIYLSALDQVLHSTQVSPGTSPKIARSVRSKFSNLVCDFESAEHARFSHLLTYATTYYGYLASGVSALAIWEKLFEEDPFSPEAGDLFRRELLAFAGTRKPEQMVFTLTGEAPSIDAFVKSRTGLI